MAVDRQVVQILGDHIAKMRNNGSRLLVLNYHRVLKAPDPFFESEPDCQLFAKQMAILANCFNVLPLHEAMVALKKKALPPRAVCITFDDGYRSIYSNAYPVLKAYRLPATIFVTSGHLDSQNMWNDRIIDMFRNYSSPQLDLRHIGLGILKVESDEDRFTVANRVVNKVKYLSLENRDKTLCGLESILGVKALPENMLSREMLIELAMNNIEIGAHTVNHPILTSIDDMAAKWEIEESKRQLETILNKPVRFFAFPNGKKGRDYDDRHVRMVKNAGYTAAYTTESRAASCQDEHLEVPRARPWDKSGLGFALRILLWLSRFK